MNQWFPKGLSEIGAAVLSGALMRSAPLFVRLQVIFARVCYNDSVTTPGAPGVPEKGRESIAALFFWPV